LNTGFGVYSLADGNIDMSLGVELGSQVSARLRVSRDLAGCVLRTQAP